MNNPTHTPADIALAVWKAAGLKPETLRKIQNPVDILADLVRRQWHRPTRSDPRRLHSIPSGSQI